MVGHIEYLRKLEEEDEKLYPENRSYAPPSNCEKFIMIIRQIGYLLLLSALPFIMLNTFPWWPWRIIDPL